MSELISRQAAIDAVRGRFSMPVDNLIVEVIGNLPSAQPEIIRCKDCEYYHPSYCEVWSKFGTIQTRESGFCYMAEHMNPPT